ncbi:hypothetical protein [Moraxella lacunata]|uniref:hypothetical protein n=1 Tax=Moraxella lacunata TaxID=477 RepID=UPI003EE3F83D
MPCRKRKNFVMFLVYLNYRLVLNYSHWGKYDSPTRLNIKIHNYLIKNKGQTLNRTPKVRHTNLWGAFYGKIHNRL